MSLGDIVAAIVELRADMRGAGATEPAIAQATERTVRASWPSVDERLWPALMTLARCAYCDGTGLVIHRNVKNRLGVIVDEGTPCRCPLGNRFLPKVKSDADFAEAGKVKKSKGFQKFGGR